MSIETILVIAAIGLYGLASILAVAYLVRPRPWAQRTANATAAVAGLSLVAALAVRGVRFGRVPAFGVFESLTWYGATITAAYLYVAGRYQTRALSVILLPFLTVVVAAGFCCIGTTVPVEASFQSTWLTLHVLAAFTGYGFFTLECVFGVLYVIQDHNLKHKRIGILFHRFPSLETLDKLMLEFIRFAFLIFTISIGLGIILAHMNEWGTRWTTDPKVAATAATWLVYAVLFHLKTSADRHGRRVALVAIAGFVCVAVTFLGVHFVTESIHDFVLFRSGPV